MTLQRFGAFSDRTLVFGPRLTLVVGANEAGKSTALAALSDLLWGIRTRSRHTFLHARESLCLQATVALPGSELPTEMVRRHSGLADPRTGAQVPTPWVTSPADTWERWDQSFGLSHAELREGGRELCRGSGDLAELVFAARSGQAVRALLDRINDEADALFKEHRGNKSVAVRRAHAGYLTALEQVRESTSRGQLVHAAREELAQAQLDIAAAQSALTAARSQVARLDQRAQAADHARSLSDVEGRLADLLGQGAAMDEAQLTRWATLEARHASAGTNLDRLQTQLDDTRRARHGIRVDAALLADDATVTRLNLSREARENDGARARALEQEASAAEREAAIELEPLTGALGERSVAAVLAEWHVPADRVVQLDAQAAAVEHAAQALLGTAGQVRTAKTRLDEVSADLQELDLDAVRAVGEVLATLRADGSATAQLLAAIGQHATELEQRDSALHRAGRSREDGVVDPVPSQDEVETARAAVAGSLAAVQRNEDALVRERKAAALAHRRRDELDVADLPERSDLLAARASRDTMLDEATRAWSGGAPFERSGHTLTGARHAAVTADELADRLARGANAAARRTELDSSVTSADTAVADAAAELAAVTRGYERAIAGWRELWSSTGLCPAPDGGAAVRAELVAARDAQSRALAQQARIDHLSPLAATQARTVRTALDRAGRPRPDGDLDSLIRAAEQVLRDADTDREARTTVRERRTDLAQAQQADEQATEARSSALAAWRVLLAAAGLPADLDPAAWRTRKGVLERAQARYAACAEKRQEVAHLTERYTAYRDEVGAVAARHGVPHDDTSPAIQVLAHRTATARADSTEAERLDGLIRRAELELAAAREEFEASTAARDQLARDALLADPAALAGAAERGRVAASLRQAHARLRDLVRASAPGEDLDALVEILTAVEPDQLEQERRSAREDVARLDEELMRAGQRRGECHQREGDLIDRDGAAELNARAKEQLAVVAQLAERFLVADIQRRLLRQELAAYESRHASPLLDAAGAILERLTEGRFVALRTTTTSGQHRALLIVGADGLGRTPEQLSEGTADQVFLALRLAGVASLQDERRASGAPTLPVVLDDVLMTFDDDRARAALAVMAELAEQWQVIVMTHHEHLTRLVPTGSRSAVTVATLAGPDRMVAAGTPTEVREMARTAMASATSSAVAEARQSRAGSGSGPGSGSGSGSGIDPSQVRAWARERGYEVGDRGRIPAQIIDAYERSQAAPARTVGGTVGIGHDQILQDRSEDPPDVV
ncbi:MAG: AAA family ATPase [Actinobacteria bacterium]|nr:AAA family ATPase [Actinomycetota bacterium]